MKNSSNIPLIVIIAVLVVFGMAYTIRTILKPEIDVAPLITEVVTSVEGVSKQLSTVSVIVNYDESGDMWVTGRDSNDRSVCRDLSELAVVLSKIEPSGRAIIAQVYEPNEGEGLLGDRRSPNVKLEAEIWTILSEHGFSNK